MEINRPIIFTWLAPRILYTIEALLTDTLVSGQLYTELTAALTKPLFTWLPYKLCIYTFW